MGLHHGVRDFAGTTREKRQCGQCAQLRERRRAHGSRVGLAVTFRVRELIAGRNLHRLEHAAALGNGAPEQAFRKRRHH